MASDTFIFPNGRTVTTRTSKRFVVLGWISGKIVTLYKTNNLAAAADNVHRWKGSIVLDTKLGAYHRSNSRPRSDTWRQAEKSRKPATPPSP